MRKCSGTMRPRCVFYRVFVRLCMRFGMRSGTTFPTTSDSIQEKNGYFIKTKRLNIRWLRLMLLLRLHLSKYFLNINRNLNLSQ